MRKIFWITFLVLIPLSIGLTLYNKLFAILLVVVIGLFIMGVLDIVQKKHAIKSNFPILGRLRYVFEHLRPKIYQYFIESNIDGTPINRLNRSLVYQRAKHERDTIPFGTELNVYEKGYEWINHSINALSFDELKFDSQVVIGNSQCLKPYSCSRFNVSAMSYGSLSKRAVLALNQGAKIGGFAHNTGEGGVSPYHLDPGGDLIWQIGTGYFGCRAADGNFCEKDFQENSQKDSVKMIELKLSQGAKPGHGGILPASKNNKEISKIRGVKEGTDVLSPPRHKAFTGIKELPGFIKKLRDLSGGKPVGFKMCIGNQSEFIEMIQEFVKQNIYPDFIAIDGGEGGTGAAPLEFSNRVGTPLIDGLVFAFDILRGFDIKQHIKIFASGKVFTGYDVLRLVALGADAVYSARGMMLALGCIQALECNSNTCPTGITSHDPRFTKGLDVDSKAKRVASFHKETLHAFMELIGALGLESIEDLRRSHIYKRVNERESKRFDELYPLKEKGSLLLASKVL